MFLNFLVPGLYNLQGGIQAYSRLLLEAIRQVVPPESLRLVSMHDTEALLAPLKAEGVDCTGFGGEGKLAAQAKFARHVFSLASSDDSAALNWTTHLNFSPLCAWSDRRQRMPFVCSAHGIEAWKIQSAVKRRALCQADLIVPVSEFTRDAMMLDLDLPAERFRVLHNTFHEAEFVLAEKPAFLLAKYGLSPATPVILTVARLDASEQYKGYEQVVRALPGILSAFPEARYILAGQGKDAGRVRTLAASMGVGHALIMPGFVGQEELPAHYSLCDVFVMPSKKEGFGIVFLEALACGKPVVAGNKDASVNALRDGALGLLVDPDDCRAVADAVLSVLSRSSSHPLLFKPEELRALAIRHFGADRFRSSVRRLLEEYGLSVRI
jgi:glycosyltransferase involved in cell wall biosynthesis